VITSHAGAVLADNFWGLTPGRRRLQSNARKYNCTTTQGQLALHACIRPVQHFLESGRRMKSAANYATTTLVQCHHCLLTELKLCNSLPVLPPVSVTKLAGGLGKMGGMPPPATA